MEMEVSRVERHMEMVRWSQGDMRGAGGKRRTDVRKRSEMINIILILIPA